MLLRTNSATNRHGTLSSSLCVQMILHMDNKSWIPYIRRSQLELFCIKSAARL